MGHDERPIDLIKSINNEEVIHKNVYNHEDGHKMKREGVKTGRGA